MLWSKECLLQVIRGDGILDFEDVLEEIDKLTCGWKFPIVSETEFILLGHLKVVNVLHIYERWSNYKY